MIRQVVLFFVMYFPLNGITAPTSITFEDRTISFKDTSIASLAFAKASEVVSFQGQVQGDSFQIDLPPINLVLLQADGMYLLYQSASYNQGIQAMSFWEAAQSLDYWLNAYSQVASFDILSSDKVIGEEIVTLQIYSKAAGQYFWKTILCSGNVAYIITTWYFDSKNTRWAEHERIVTSFTILSSEKLESDDATSKDLVTYLGSVNGDTFQVDMLPLDILVVARKYECFLSEQEGYTCVLLAQPYLNGASAAEFWIAYYSKSGLYTLLDSDASDKTKVLTVQVWDNTAQMMFRQSIFCTSNSCFMLTTICYDGIDYVDEHNAFANSFKTRLATYPPLLTWRSMQDARGPGLK